MMADPEIVKEVEIAKAESVKLFTSTNKIKIRKDEDLKGATAQLTDIKRVFKNMDGRRKSITAPMRQAMKEVDELFKNPLAALKDAEVIIKDEILRYHDSVERRAAKRADKIEGQVDSGELPMADAMGKLNNIKQADSNIQTESGSANIKKVQKIRIVNPAELPAKYFLRTRVIEALRIEVAEDIKKGEQLPAGAESYEDRQVAVRA